MNQDWNKLNSLQIGKYAEYFAKMEFISYGFDVYTVEVDDKGIDFLLRIKENVFEIQVKGVYKSSTIYFTKEKFNPKDNYWIALVRFVQGKFPELYMIPSMDFLNPDYGLLTIREYGDDRVSKPEYGINLAKMHQNTLSNYSIENFLKRVFGA